MTTNQGTAGQGVDQGQGASADALIEYATPESYWGNEDESLGDISLWEAVCMFFAVVTAMALCIAPAIIIGAASAVLWVAIYVIWGAL